MPIKITPKCKHCGEPVAQGADYFSPWFHTGRYGDESTSRKCDPSDPHSTLAIPLITVVKRQQKEEE